MDKTELQKIIDTLEKNQSTEDAYFGIFQYGGAPDESYIKANKEGLELFSLELLKAAKVSENFKKKMKLKPFRLILTKNG